MKGPKLLEEIEESKNAIELLGGKISHTVDYLIDGDQRNMLLVKKTFKTPPTYPRKFSKIKSSPL